MSLLKNFLVALIALEHLAFLVLEMFLWDTPTGHAVFKTDAAFASQSAALAANQGLYNGFLAAGLIWSLLPSAKAMSQSLRIFFLGCVVVAGLYGAYSVSSSILFTQATPALIALLLTLFFKNHSSPSR